MDTETEKNFQAVLQSLEEFIKAETVVGKPIYIGQAFLIPLFRVSIGLGAGKAGDKNTGSPEGTGIGASIVPHAVISVNDKETTVISLAHKGTLQTVTESLPEILKTVCQEEVPGNQI